jgi:hypothetical protein
MDRFVAYEEAKEVLSHGDTRDRAVIATFRPYDVESLKTYARARLPSRG